jgi:hypothetical protein
MKRIIETSEGAIDLENVLQVGKVVRRCLHGGTDWHEFTIYHKVELSRDIVFKSYVEHMTDLSDYMSIYKERNDIVEKWMGYNEKNKTK